MGERSHQKQIIVILLASLIVVATGCVGVWWYIHYQIGSYGVTAEDEKVLLSEVQAFTQDIRFRETDSKMRTYCAGKILGREKEGDVQVYFVRLYEGTFGINPTTEKIELICEKNDPVVVKAKKQGDKIMIQSVRRSVARNDLSDYSELFPETILMRNSRLGPLEEKEWKDEAREKAEEDLGQFLDKSSDI